MEKDRSQTATNNTTSQPVHTRILCAVCNAPAIGKGIKEFLFFNTLHFYIHLHDRLIFIYLGRNFDAMTCLSCKGTNDYLLLLDVVDNPQ